MYQVPAKLQLQAQIQQQQLLKSIVAGLKAPRGHAHTYMIDSVSKNVGEYMHGASFSRAQAAQTVDMAPGMPSATPATRASPPTLK